MIELILAIICTEATTELVVHSQIFEPFRNFMYRLGEFQHKLVSCGYCFSIWASFLFAILLAPYSEPTYWIPINIFIWMLVIHRASNFLNDFADRYLREPDTFDRANRMFDSHE